MIDIASPPRAVARGAANEERSLPAEDAGRLWRPFVDRPLLTPRMTLGLDEAAPADQERLLRYLAALVVVRRAPVHVNVAFNAAYFGFDLTTNSYVGGALNDLFSLPEVRLDGAAEALPVGALVNLAVGPSPLFAEVVYKEGAHPQLGDDGSLPSWLSGAPAGAVGPGVTDDDPASVLRERLVVDTDAFGADLSLTPQQLDRLRRAGRGLDADGHVVLGSAYSSREHADLDDVSFYARYLLTRGRDQVLSAAAPLPLAAVLADTAREDDYEAALLGLLRTVAQALSRIGELRMWRGYAFTRAGLGARLKAQGPLGGPDLETVAAQLARSAVPSRPPRWGPQQTVTYTAIGPRLRDVRGAAPHLAGLGYATAVCHANSVVSDYVRGESDEVTGLLADDVALRLDDPWQGGGVWRAEHPGSKHARVDITQPLGLGWAASLPPETQPDADEETPPQPAPTEPEPEPEPEPQPDPTEPLIPPGDGDEPAGLTVSDSQISWTQPLRLSHMLYGRLPLPEQAAGAMRGGAPRLRLLLRHDGYDLDAVQAHQDTDTELYGPRPQLTGIDWPLEFFPGILLTCTWPRGGGVIRASSTLLDQPVTVDGFEIEHRYDPAILTRDAAPGEGRRGQPGPGGSTGPLGTLTLAQRVLRAVRRLGHLDPTGRAVLRRDALAAAVYGGATDQAEDTLDDVVDRLVRDGDLRLDEATVDGSDLRFPAMANGRAVDVLVYEPSVAPGPPRRERVPAQRRFDARLLRPTDVVGHLRYIGHLGWEASAEAQEAYREDRRRFGLAGPAGLPRGYTYVSPFVRGG